MSRIINQINMVGRPPPPTAGPAAGQSQNKKIGTDHALTTVNYNQKRGKR